MEESFEFREVKLYIEDLLMVNQAPKNLAFLVYELLMCKNKKNQIIINSFVKKDLAKKSGLSKGTVDNTLTKLIDTGLFIRLDRGVYKPHDSLLNALNLSNGQAVSIIITYQDQDKEIKTM